MFRLGILDFDSSHCVEFTKRFNHIGVSRDQFVSGARVVLGVPGTSTMSPERIPRHTQQMADCGVSVVESPEQLLGNVDAVLVLSVCGESHLASARPFLEAGIPTFVDKPFACTWEDAKEMAALAAKHKAVLWSCSAMRYAEEVQRLIAGDSRYSAVQGALSFGPAIRAVGNPGLLHYGIHAAELLFTLLGDDWQTLSCQSREAADLIHAEFSGGRFGTLRGSRSGSTAYGFTAFCERGIVHELVSTRFAYRNLCQAMVESLETKNPPVPIETTLKLIRFLLTANQSQAAGGQPIDYQA